LGQEVRARRCHCDRYAVDNVLGFQHRGGYDITAQETPKERLSHLTRSIEAGTGFIWHDERLYANAC